MLDNNVSRSELAEHKKEIFGHVDSKFNIIVDQIKAQGDRQDKVIEKILPSLNELVIDKAKKDVYWKLLIFVSSTAFAGVCALAIRAFMLPSVGP